MNILFATMEVAPFSKVGGLGDVSKALSEALCTLDVSITVVTPWYRALPRKGELFQHMRTLRETTLWLGDTPVPITWLTPERSGPGPRLLFVSEPQFLSREGPYVSGYDAVTHAQEPQASILFSKAIAEWVANSGEAYSVVHLNEHQTALAAPLLRQNAKSPPVVLTVHNFGHQGVYDPWVLPLLGLPSEWHYALGPLEYYGKVNFLKAGVWFSDAVTTVSETYRQEVMTQYEFGRGLEGLMSANADHFVGIINGIDGKDWNPGTSPHISPHYSVRRLEGKNRVKEKLLEETGLPASALTIPLAAVILRLVEQKGIDLILAVAERLLNRPALMIVMGEGKPAYKRAFQNLQNKYPERCRVYTRYEEGMAHRITAGADIFLMPSRFEPCGLNQLYSLAFGTVPVVRHTGGLADTVIDVRYHSEAGTGFTFRDATPGAFWRSVAAALEYYSDRKAWQKMMRRGMREGHAWEVSARRYITMYTSLTSGTWPRVA